MMTVIKIILSLTEMTFYYWFRYDVMAGYIFVPDNLEFISSSLANIYD